MNRKMVRFWHLFLVFKGVNRNYWRLWCIEPKTAALLLVLMLGMAIREFGRWLLGSPEPEGEPAEFACEEVTGAQAAAYAARNEKK